jgi:hypothetical protein
LLLPQKYRQCGEQELIAGKDSDVEVRGLVQRRRDKLGREPNFTLGVLLAPLRWDEWRGCTRTSQETRGQCTGAFLELKNMAFGCKSQWKI